jgi:hypothetical protein
MLLPNNSPSKSIGVKFTKDGPSIPIELLQALEDGELVIFCGAGVSRHLGLPDFDGLVQKVSKRLGRPLQPDEADSYGNRAFDITFGLIENRIGPISLRGKVRDVLEVKADFDLSTHRALLQLATSKKGHLRLVTTNFDRAFEIADAEGNHTIDYAPYLPLPAGNWNSIVHLHGGLGNSRDPDGEFLVLTSADFGRAYITEAWASRFLSELFRRAAAILFVGYSVSDPAVRYIVDAFAADRANQDSRVARAYSFTGTTSDKALLDERTWRSRGIAPIIYEVQGDDHRLLHETIQSCARRYRNGFFDRDSIVIEYGAQSPRGGLGQEAISQITWALNEKTGHAARTFSELVPAPALEWLDVFEAHGLFTISALPLTAYPPVAWGPASQFVPPPHPTTAAFCRWLCSHLASARLVEWVIKRGAHFHPSLADGVRDRLAGDEALCIPTGARLIWEFLSAWSPAVHNPAIGQSVWAHKETLEKQGWNPLLRDLVLSWLAPTIEFKLPWRWGAAEDVELERVSSYADTELIPAAGEASWQLADRLFTRQDADQIALEILGELTNILRRGLTYLEFLQGASEDNDRTFIGRPSIDDHPQNSRFHHWAAYIHLLRMAWERVAATDPDRGREEVARWMRMRYPLFRRLVLWSAGRPGGPSPAESLSYLSKQPASALWGLDTHRELLQYLTRIAALLSVEEMERLTGIVVKGPPRTQFRADLDEEEFLERWDQAVHLRLMKLLDGGVSLPAKARELLDQILVRHAEWSGPTTERDEFLMWMGEASAIDPHRFEPQLDDFRDWNDETVISSIMTDPTGPKTVACWRGLLRADSQRAIRLLDSLGTRDFFDGEIWALALGHLSSETTSSECVRLFSAHVLCLGSDFVSKNLYELSQVVDRYCSGKQTGQDVALWGLWDQLLEPALQRTPEDDADPVDQALNSPIGHLTEALLIKLGELNPGDYDAIPQSMQDRLTSLLTGSKAAHRSSRLLLAQALTWLHRLNPDLVEASFLPRFDWAASGEARNVWLGYLISPQVTPKLWAVLRPFFLDAFQRSPILGQREDQLYSLLAYLLLREDFPLGSEEARLALTVGSQKGRSQVAWYWWRQVDSATEYGATLFRERLRCLLTDVWPLEQELKEEGSSENLARLALCCGTEFGQAVETITPLLTKLTSAGHFILSMAQKDHAARYPLAALALMDSLIGTEIEAFGWSFLKSLLAQVATAQPSLVGDPRFTRLNQLVQRFD